MCDCYLANCEICGVGIHMHIGDYSTERELVKVYCPLHSKHLDGLECEQVFTDSVSRKDQIEGDTFTIGDVVVILCYDLDGHHIHLN